ncbi:MAG: hypothetical protein L0387_03110 [Acidobacteria bacterium]|nr:hypothetical protein [Acidobacteriota bacterium]MCI0723843.1 hypothetical protein [Acidobacteriota bacterium]
MNAESAFIVAGRGAFLEARRSLPAADSRDNRDLRAVPYVRLKTPGVADIFVADEYVDVLPELSLLGYHTVANTWTPLPQRFQGISQRGRRLLNDDVAFAGSERTQGAGY